MTNKKLFWGDAVVLLIIGVVILLAFSLYDRAEGVNTAQVIADGKVVKTFILSKNESYSPNDGKTVIEVKNGEIFVSHSDCENQNCVHMGKITKKGGFIACVPNRIAIVAQNSEYDAVAG